jgi:hypothetical protein
LVSGKKLAGGAVPANKGIRVAETNYFCRPRGSGDPVNDAPIPVRYIHILASKIGGTLCTNPTNAVLNQHN